MKTDGRESTNIEDRRASGSRRTGLVGGGLGAIVIVIAALFFGVDPQMILGLLGNAPAPSRPAPSTKAAPPQDPQARFVSVVLADTEDTWRPLFQASGRQYEDPRLVLFTGATPTACGAGQAAAGPFYCPLDRSVYIDLAFYDELQRRFKAPGDFAQAYVIAHEVGHHVQHQLGIMEEAQALEKKLPPEQARQVSVRLELQADCFAGVWAHHAQKARQVVEPGDIEEALRAAAAVGDDTLQKAAQGRVVPESFTHGSAEQRARWFRTGWQSGRIADCNTFARGAA